MRRQYAVGIHALIRLRMAVQLLLYPLPFLEQRRMHVGFTLSWVGRRETPGFVCTPTETWRPIPYSLKPGYKTRFLGTFLWIWHVRNIYIQGHV